MKRFLKSTNWLMLLSGILTVILGITTLFAPFQGVTGLAVFIGIVIALSGLSSLLKASRMDSGPISDWMLFESVVTILIGVWIAFGSGIRVLWVALPFIFAGLVIASGVIRIKRASQIKAKEPRKYKWIVALGVAECVVGAVLLFSPLLSTRLGMFLLSLLMILYGASDIALALNAEQVSAFLRRIVQSFRLRRSGNA